MEAELQKRMSFITNIDSVDAVRCAPYIRASFMTKKLMRTVLMALAAIVLQGVLFAQTPQNAPPELKLDTGQEIFEAACIACHGPSGRGQPESTLGFEKPSTFPDFTDCNGSVREKTFDWKATIHEGGRGRGFVEIMPSFSEALTSEQIDKVV